MNRIAFALLAVASHLVAAPAHAVTNDEGDILISQAAVNAGGITPGDTPGSPITISVPGTYRLTTNLTVTTAVNGIEVRANDVTIEMGGHTLAGSGVGRNGVTSFNRGTHLMNGNIRGFTNDGVRTISQYLTVSNLVITGNGRQGIFTDPALRGSSSVGFARIEGSTVTHNDSDGITCGENCRVDNTVASSNGGTGISFQGYGGEALGNTATGNGVCGIYFSQAGGAGNNTMLGNLGCNLGGIVVHMQPNACSPTCLPPP